MNDQVRVIKHDTIPPVPDSAGGKIHRIAGLRDFTGSVDLRSFLTEDVPFAASWMHLGAGDVVEPQVNAESTLVIACTGDGILTSLNERRTFLPGDVALLHKGSRCTIEAGTEGLRFLSLEFCRSDAGTGSSSALPTDESWGESRPLEQIAKGAVYDLLAENEKRALSFGKRPLFELLASNELSKKGLRSTYLAYRRTWYTAYQNLLFARQASCVDPIYSELFLRDFEDELTAQPLLPIDSNYRDAALDALAQWFGYQMHIVDDVEKLAITHLVLASANSMLEKTESAAFGVADQRSQRTTERRRATRLARGAALLSRQTPEVHARVSKRIAESWDMANALVDRLAELTLGSESHHPPGG